MELRFNLPLLPPEGRTRSFGLAASPRKLGAGRVKNEKEPRRETA